MIRSRVTVENVQQVTRELKQFEDGAIRSLRSDLRVALGPIANQVATEIPRQSPLRKPSKGGGMSHKGKTRWRGVNKPRIEFTPGRRRDRSHKLVNISMTGGARGLGFDYAELAGIRRRPPKEFSKEYTRSDGEVRQHRLNGQGDGLIKALEDQVMQEPGRFAFTRFLKRKRLLNELTIATINKHAEKVNHKLRVR